MSLRLHDLEATSSGSFLSPSPNRQGGRERKSRLGSQAEVMVEKRRFLVCALRVYCPNPEGEDQGKESVTLTNQGTTLIYLTGWKLRNRAGGEAPLSDQLAAGAYRALFLLITMATKSR
jgi:hypothetical protein